MSNYGEFDLYTMPDYDTSISTVKQTADSVSAEVKDARGDKASLKVALNYITSSLTDRIDDLSVGGENILLRTKTLGNATLCTGADTSTLYNSLTAAHFNRTATTSYSDLITWSSIFTPEADSDYTVSFYAKGNGSITNFLSPTACSSVINSQGITGTGSDGINSITLSTDWKRYWITYHTTSSVSGAKTIIIGRISGAGEAYVCGVKLEKGNKATDWCPAIDDTNADINSVSSSITQTASSIRADIATTNGDVATLKQSLDTISLSVNKTIPDSVTAAKDELKTMIGKVDVKADSVTTTVSTMQGTIGNMTQSIQDANGWRYTIASQASGVVVGANGEAITNNTDISFDTSGITVAGLPRDESGNKVSTRGRRKTKMTTTEFAGYYSSTGGNADSDYEKVFALDEDKVYTNKLVAKKGCDFITIKQVPFIATFSGTTVGCLAFVKSGASS